MIPNWSLGKKINKSCYFLIDWDSRPTRRRKRVCIRNSFSWKISWIYYTLQFLVSFHIYEIVLNKLVFSTYFYIPASRWKLHWLIFYSYQSYASHRLVKPSQLKTISWDDIDSNFKQIHKAMTHLFWYSAMFQTGRKAITETMRHTRLHNLLRRLAGFSLCSND